MAKRHTDAIAIQCGACNPSAIANSIVAACAEIRAEPGYSGTAAITDDAAVRLMVHQLAFICHVSEIDTSLDTYSKLVDECRGAI